MSRFLQQLAHRVIGRRRAVIALIAVLTAACLAHAIGNLRIGTSIESVIAEDFEANQTLERLRDAFGNDEMLLLIVSGDVFSPEFLDRLRALEREVEVLSIDLPSLGTRKANAERAEGGDALLELLSPRPRSTGEPAPGAFLEGIFSVLDAPRNAPAAGMLDGATLRDGALSREALTEAKQRVLKDPLFVPTLVSGSGRHATVLIRTGFMERADAGRLYHAVSDLAARHHVASTFGIRVSGMVAIDTVLAEMMFADMRRMAGIGILATLLVLALIFRHPIAVLAPMAVAALSTLWTFGIMSLCGAQFTQLTVVLPPFLMCVGVCASIHILSVYRELRGGGLDNHPALVEAIARTGRACLFTGITTVAGLASFGLASLRAVRELGLLAAAGVLLSLVFTFTLLPALIASTQGFLPHRGARGGGSLDRFLHWSAGLDRSPRRIARPLLFCLLATLAATAGLLRLQVKHDPVRWLPSDAAITRDLLEIDDALGGSSIVYLLIEAKEEEGLLEPGLIRGLAALQEHMEAYPGAEGEGRLVRASFGVVDLLRSASRAMGFEGDLPESRPALAEIFTLLSSSHPAQLRLLTTPDMRTTQFVLRVPWMEASACAPFIEHLKSGVERHLGGRATVHATGKMFTVYSVLAFILHDLATSFSGALLSVALLMLFHFRELKLTLISLIPNVLPIVWILGTMGWLGIPLDMSNLVLACIVLGIAVDDTIHFFHHWQVRYRLTGDPDEAIRYALSIAGRAMVQSTMILVAGFAVYLAASMIHTQRFGWLTSLTFLYAMFQELVLAPALLRLFYRRVRREPGSGADDAAEQVASDQPQQLRVG